MGLFWRVYYWLRTEIEPIDGDGDGFGDGNRGAGNGNGFTRDDPWEIWGSMVVVRRDDVDGA